MKQIILWILLGLLLCGCEASQKEEPTVPQPSAAGKETMPSAYISPKPGEYTVEPEPVNVNPSGQLMAEAEDHTAAEKLAEQYGITLVEYQEGLAVFFTEEDPQEVIRRGEENGWPQLSLNRMMNMY